MFVLSQKKTFSKHIQTNEVQVNWYIQLILQIILYLIANPDTLKLIIIKRVFIPNNSQVNLKLIKVETEMSDN